MISLSELEYSYNPNKDYLRIEYSVDMNIQGEEFYKGIKQRIINLDKQLENKQIEILELEGIIRELKAQLTDRGKSN